MNETRKLQNQSLLNRSLYNQKLVKLQRASDDQQEFNGKILSYSEGTYRVRLENGSVVNARAISNSSAISLGSSVTVVTPRNGVAIIDAMPT